MRQPMKPRPIEERIVTMKVVGWRHECSECLAPFESKHLRAKTCGGNCRWHRFQRLKAEAGG